VDVLFINNKGQGITFISNEDSDEEKVIDFD
jgi:hypothetical protein